MANLMKWRRPTGLSLRRDIEEILEDFDLPRGFRREIERIFSEDLSPRTLWAELERTFDEFVSPLPLRRRMAHLFEPLTGVTSLFGRRGEVFIPEVELTERENAYVLHVDLPGLREQDLKVTVDDENILTISGERHRDERRHERGYEYTERSYGSFTRSVQLPRGADTSKIEADYRNGVLAVEIPKTELARARHIPVHGRERAEPHVIEPREAVRRERIQVNANVPG